MTEAEANADRLSPARIYDYLLGGTASTPADRRAVDQLLANLPEIADGAEANRGFLRRAARFMAESGIDQFIDLGSGLPTQNNTDEVVRRVNPDARVVFVDSDPLVLEHVSRLQDGTVRAVHADVRQASEVLADPAMGIIDFTRPVGILLVAVLHFITDEHRPVEIIQTYLDAVPSGSYLALSHLNGDGQPTRSIENIKAAWAGTETGIHFRSRSRVAEFFPGLRLLPPYPGAAPGLVPVGQWGADDPDVADSDGSRWAICAVGRKP